ncbi:hypothetical protein CDD82_568 [Ophiocordyceps australis]|uniref:DNA polymerase eta n=1 Tax=Ophiocordyceps australis TaxID=1399860 RepID=A0A2C5YM96_9HYPO|nr:hypothetical protein CDD82_568 [Ophiocordyceps australis]
MSTLVPASSPGRRSRFTYRHLSQLASYSTSSPLRVVAHIDLDAFYAQCEMVRLGVPQDKPLAVQQWQGLIAVNYPARASGITRHCNVTNARKLCPNLIAQHVATWREGDDKWSYRDDAAAHIATDKVSLDPYRMQSRRILALIKELLPRDLQKVEKASIDEVFLDLSAHVHSLLLDRFAELTGPPPYDDATEALPLPSIVALDWQADALVDLDEDEEALDPDWDDVAILTGSEIVRAIRAQIRERLGYTCSAGVANNKLISKLGSGFKKPNCQTVIRSRAVHTFLAGFKLPKLRNLGGKLGDQVVSTFHTDNLEELLNIALSQFKAKFGDETGIWLYNTIRGVDNTEVNPRTLIKSMLSAKSFRPSINSFDQANKWLRIFAADLYSRLVDEGATDDNKRRPRTVNLHHRTAGQTRSRQGPISPGKVLSEALLFTLAQDLLSQISADGTIWPCDNLSLSMGGFEDAIKGNMGIDSFLIKGARPISLPEDSDNAQDGPSKRARNQLGGLHRFFAKQQSGSADVGRDKDGVGFIGVEQHDDAATAVKAQVWRWGQPSPDEGYQDRRATRIGTWQRISKGRKTPDQMTVVRGRADAVCVQCVAEKHTPVGVEAASSSMDKQDLNLDESVGHAVKAFQAVT